MVETSETDFVLNLDQEEWDLPENYFEKIRAWDLFEHLDNPMNFMENVHRIGSKDAEVVMKCPHRSSQNWTDPTHQRLVGIQTIDKYFTDEGMYAYYTDANFQVENAKILFVKSPFMFWNYLIEPVVNITRATQLFYEYTFLSRWFPAQDIYFKLKVKKN